MNLYGVPESIKLDRGSGLKSKNYKLFRKNKNIDLEYSPPRVRTDKRAVERAKKR